MGSFEDDYRWQLQFVPHVGAILCQVFGLADHDISFTSRYGEDDRKRNTDAWIMLNGHPFRVSSRVRRYVIADQFTIRYERPTSSTEWHKLWAGYGAFYFYGKGHGGMKPWVSDWFLGDLAVLRRWASSYFERDEEPPGVVKRNTDGSSSFVIFARHDLPREFTIAEDEETELREAAWAIVKDAKGMNATGHERAVRWARAVLGLDEARP